MCGTSPVPCSCARRGSRPSDNDPPSGSVMLSPSPNPAASVPPTEVLWPQLAPETRRNGRWRYGRKLRDEQAGALMTSHAEHTVLPRPDRRPGVPGVDAQTPVQPPQISTTRRPASLPTGVGGCP